MKQFAVNKKLSFLLSAVVVLLVAFCVLTGNYLYNTKADNNSTLSPVSLDSLDYNSMEITLNMNGNAILYYSTNRKTWNEADGTVITGSQGNAAMLYDISWVSMSGKATLYFRGNMDRTTCAVAIPAYNKKFKAKFDKMDGTFDFENTEGIEVIRWRKITDYTWNYIWAEHGKADLQVKNDSSDPYYAKYGFIGKIQKLESFENDVMRMRVKGTKLMFQTVPMVRKEGNDGAPPSKEVKVAIPALKAAPNIKVNVKKLTVNSTIRQQWSTTRSAVDTNWQNCTKAMSIETIAPEAASGSAMQSVYFRTAATSSASPSKVTTLEIPAREAAPEAPFAFNAIAPTSAKRRATATLSFSNVPSVGYQYTVVKTGTLDETRASWKAVRQAKTIKFNDRNLPAGSIIYVRTAGVAKNVNKNIDLKLPSKCYSFVVPAYPAAPSTTP